MQIVETYKHHVYSTSAQVWPGAPSLLQQTAFRTAHIPTLDAVARSRASSLRYFSPLVCRMGALWHDVTAV